MGEHFSFLCWCYSCPRVAAWARGPCGVQSGLKPRGSMGWEGGRILDSFPFFSTELLSALAGRSLHCVSFFAVCKWEHVSPHRAAVKLN